MSVVSMIEWLCLGLAVFAAWLSLRPSPPLDWERLWKVTVATVIRGEVERAGGDAEAWWTKLAAVPFHPVGRNAVRKLSRPDVDAIAVPALEGERALVLALAALETPVERWRAMYVESEDAREALVTDPTDLGAAYDPARVTGPDVTWDAIAAWNDVVQVGLTRRLGDVILAVVGLDAAGLQAAVPHGRVQAVDADALSTVELQPHERMVVVTASEDAFTVVQALHGDACLRDRVRAVVALGPDLAGDERSAWLEVNFTHATMDTEINRRTPYLSVIDVDPTDPLGRSWDAQRFPAPPMPPSGWEPIESIDLGPLHLAALDPMVVGRALWVLLAFCLADR